MAASFSYSGDEMNTDQEDDYCYISDCDDWHDDTFQGDSNLSYQPRETSFTVLTEQDIRKRQEKDITEISSVLQVSKESACLILLYYNWSVSTVHEEWFADEENVRKAVGVLVETPKVKYPVHKKFKCGICFDMFTCNYLHSVGCEHRFCNCCWKGYIITSINNGPGCLMLRCPEPSCVAAVGPEMIGKFASNKDKEKYDSFLLRSYVESSRKIKWCNAPGCDCAVETEVGSESYDVICSCSSGFCWNCKEDAHRPVDCETVAKWIKKNSSESLNTSWILVNTKPCPKCKRAIEKNHGCNHMTCNSSCGFQFCWICLQGYSEHREVACNAYRRDKEVGVVNELERRRLRAKKSLDRYTHYYERWATNNSSWKQAIKDLEEMQKVHLEKLSEAKNKPVTELVFVEEAWQQIVECRRVLKWTYAYGYYLCEQELNEKLKLFEHLQGQAELNLERLHHCAEKEMMGYISDKPSDGFNEFRTKLANLTTITRTYFENLVNALENGLSEVSNLKDQRSNKSR